MHARTTTLAPLALFLVACTTDSEPSTDPSAATADGGPESSALVVETIVEGLNNPAFVSFSTDGLLTVCDAGPGRENGNGRVLAVRDGEVREHLTGFPTEYWKRGADGEPDRYKLGPLGALWLADGRLLVANSGLGDGEDHLRVFEGAGTVDDGVPSNAIAPTSDDPADKGEGNLTGLSQGPDGTVFVAGQGADAKSWTLAWDPTTGELTPLASADEHGIAINSPMATLPWDGDLLVLYSGAGGTEDGLLVRWDLEDGTPSASWTLPGLFDPMGMARIPGTDALAVVDNQWALKQVGAGRLGRVRLPASGGAAEVELLLEDLAGPTSCAFGPDGRLYVALLGPEFDADRGSVVAIDGLD